MSEIQAKDIIKRINESDNYAHDGTIKITLNGAVSVMQTDREININAPKITLK